MSRPHPSSAADHGPDPLQAVACPRCFGALAVAREQWGRPAACPLCGSSFRVPPRDGEQPGRDPAENVKKLAFPFSEPGHSHGGGDDLVVLRRREAAEKEARRARRNIFMLVAGVAILLSIVLLLGRER